VNNPTAVYRAENKAYQLKIAKRYGLSIPHTFVCNRLPSDFDITKTYIIKSLDAALFYDNGDELFTYSTMVSGNELINSDLKLAPVILQDYLEEKTDIRVTVIGTTMFAVSITHQGVPIIGDWRILSKENLVYTPIELPKTIENKVSLVMKHLDLNYGGVDLALSRGKYYFIEVNPTGEWGWLTYSTGLPITSSIIDFMMQGN